jgi:hypothetical protein
MDVVQMVHEVLPQVDAQRPAYVSVDAIGTSTYGGFPPKINEE